MMLDDPANAGLAASSEPSCLPDPRPAAPTPSRLEWAAGHTPGFPSLLRRIRSSLLVTTYQAGKLAIVREAAGSLNVHFRNFQAPMGMALQGNRLAVGSTTQVWEFVDVPGVAASLEPKRSHDACFLPRSSHFTGNIQGHEMAWDNMGELWVVNTRFSCLCTLDPSASFRPRWRPPFVSALEPSDRCHLNGLAMVNGYPGYVTALGESDRPEGWREKKADGGVVVDIASGEVIARGLSMPHSPRWHSGRLWICESGSGSFGSIDLKSGKYQPLVRLPGFTRGLDFFGNYAFIGLSQARENRFFGSIDITKQINENERVCGVCVVEITTGKPIALLRFESAVQEVFSVTLLPGVRFPELVNDDQVLLDNSFVVPTEFLGDVSPSLLTSQLVRKL